MKVYELLSRLEKAAAGADVVVGMHSTLNANIECVAIDDETVTITGGDAQLIDENGNESGLLSYHSQVEEDE